MSVTTPTTPMFTGVPPVTANSTSHADAQFTIPDDWNGRCRQDHDWCRHFIEEAIKNLQLSSLFPGVTVVPVQKISPSTLRDIKDRCKTNITCYDDAVQAEQIKMTEDYLMGRFPEVGTVSTENQLQIVFAIGLLSFFFAILGGALLFYFVFMPHDQIGCSFKIPFLDDDPVPEGGGGGLPPPPPPEPLQTGQGIPAPVPGPVVQPGQNQPMTVNQGFTSANSQSKGKSAKSKTRKSSQKSKKLSKSKKKNKTNSSKQSSKKSKKSTKSSKSSKKKKK